MPVVVVVVHAVAKKEKVEEFKAEALRIAQKVRQEEAGNLCYDIAQDPAEPTRFVFYEAYTDAAALAAHNETAHFKHFVEVAPGLVAEPLQVSRLDALFHANNLCC